jgi:membrane-bound lytic murein transglycosylase F
LKLLTVFFIGLFLTFCSQRPNILSEVRESGELRVITRNNPTTYYEGANGPTGFEFDLAKGFAAYLGVKLRIVAAGSPSALLAGVRRAKGHLAAGLKVTEERKDLVRFGPVYEKVREQVVYRRGSRRPRSADELSGKLIRVAANSSHAETLEALKSEHPDLTWEEHPQADSAELLELVWRQAVDYTIADSTEVAITRNFYPELGVAFDIGEPRPLAWAFPRNTDDSLYIAAVKYFDSIRSNGELERLIERHFAHVARFDYVGTRKLIEHINERLPQYLDEFKVAAKKYGVDWRLLGAIGYQESHWNPDARSPTGVRGLMMLTLGTADQLGIEDRSDPVQSIFGGAEYFAQVKAKIPERVAEPDRTWLALAAYNVGFGHLEDARVLAQRAGEDADKWVVIKKYLPLLSKKKWYSQTRYGYARGFEPVRYVQKVRRYFDMLVWVDRRDRPKRGYRQEWTPIMLPML